MTGRIIPFPELYPAHTPRAEPCLVLILPVIRIEREYGTDDSRRRGLREPDFLTTDFPLIDGPLTRGPR